jgi:TolA-binding protein
MQEGNAALARRDYAAAEAAAREVLAARGSPRAYDAQFLLAQSLAGKRDHGQAAVAYDDTYNRARTGAHAADALLGLAGSLTALNERKAACDTLAKFTAEFPGARPNQRESASALRQRAQCR